MALFLKCMSVAACLIVYNVYAKYYVFGDIVHRKWRRRRELHWTKDHNSQTRRAVVLSLALRLQVRTEEKLRAILMKALIDCCDITLLYNKTCRWAKRTTITFRKKKRSVILLSILNKEIVSHLQMWIERIELECFMYVSHMFHWINMS